jgi:serine/threonine-protein kinase
MGAMLAKICHCPVSSLRGRRPDLPAELDRIILHCLDRDPDRRVKDVRALAEALLPFAAARSRFSVARIDGRDS